MTDALRETCRKLLELALVGTEMVTAQHTPRQ